jgi:hypothetical protein
MKNLAKLNGAKALSKNEQKSINGGFGPILTDGSCRNSPDGTLCFGNFKREGICVNNVCEWFDEK